jgi:hypothetical protein
MGRGPAWLLILFAVAFSVDFVMQLAAYIFFMLTNSDALRSEKYSIAKTGSYRLLEHWFFWE